MIRHACAVFKHYEGVVYPRLNPQCIVIVCVRQFPVSLAVLPVLQKKQVVKFKKIIIAHLQAQTGCISVI